MRLYWSKSLGHGFRIGGKIGGTKRKTRTRTKSVRKEKKPLTPEQKNKRKLIWGIVLIVLGSSALLNLFTEEFKLTNVVVCLLIVAVGVLLIYLSKNTNEE